MPWITVWVSDAEKRIDRTELLIEPTNSTVENLRRIAELMTGKRDLSFFRDNSPKEIHRIFNERFGDPPDSFVNEVTERNYKYVQLPEEMAAMAYSYMLAHSEVCEELVEIVRDAAYSNNQVDLDFERKTIKRRLEDEIDSTLAGLGYSDEAKQWAVESRRALRDEFYGFSKFECALKRLIIIRLVQDGVPIKGTTLPISECTVSGIFPECRKYQTMKTEGEEAKEQD